MIENNDDKAPTDDDDNETIITPQLKVKPPPQALLSQAVNGLSGALFSSLQSVYDNAFLNKVIRIAKFIWRIFPYLLIGITVITLGVMGYVFYSTLTAKPDARFELELEQARQEKRRQDFDKKEEAQYFLEYPFFRPSPIRLPILQDEQIVGYVFLKIEFEAFDKDSYEESRIKLPRITDQINIDLYAIFSSLWIPGHEPSINLMKKHIRRSCEKIMGKKKIKSVLIREFFIEQ